MTSLPVHPDPEWDSRTLPAVPVPFPTALEGRGVIAAALVPARAGEFSQLAVMVVRENDRPPLRAYAVLDAAYSGGWHGSSGTYACSYVNAVEIFMERLNHRI